MEHITVLPAKDVPHLAQITGAGYKLQLAASLFLMLKSSREMLFSPIFSNGLVEEASSCCQSDEQLSSRGSVNDSGNFLFDDCMILSKGGYVS